MILPKTQSLLCGRRILLLALAALLGSASVGAQQSAQLTVLDFATGSGYEDYLRVLQVAGMAPLHPWSLRGFSPREITRLLAADTAGPWSLRDRFTGKGFAIGPFSVRSTFNSSYPYGANDGPVWAGRGLTSSLSGGFSAHVGPLSIAIAPIAFRAGNADFELLSNGRSGAQAFGHGSFARMIDLPQRFGDSPYSRVDPGASGIRLDSRFLSVGASTANQWIGPATEYPFLLGTNAPGFPHLFAGTGNPVNLWIARAHARLTWGKLHQSDFSPVTGTDRFIPDSQGGTVRLAAHGALVLVPRGIPGLEIGVARFMHVPYRAGEPSGDFWAKPLKVLFLEKEYARGDSAGADNQLASIFFRWVMPGSGFELFGERGYDDQFFDLREFIQNPDHMREYMLGFQKVFRRGPRTLDVLKGELVNYQRSHLDRVRVEGGIYLHSTLRQGHTNRGQLLGANPGAGAAAASTLSWTRYSPRGRTGAVLRRIVRNQRGNYPETGIRNPDGTDVILAAGVERTRFGRHFDIGARIEAMQNFNRNFSGDAANLHLELMARWHP